MRKTERMRARSENNSKNKKKTERTIQEEASKQETQGDETCVERGAADARVIHPSMRNEMVEAIHTLLWRDVHEGHGRDRLRRRSTIRMMRQRSVKTECSALSCTPQLSNLISVCSLSVFSLVI